MDRFTQHNTFGITLPKVQEAVAGDAGACRRKEGDEVSITTTPSRSAVTMTALQRAYAVGRRPDLPLGGVECLAYLEFRGRHFDATRL